jgi:nitrate reductase cytochrome c-type subunit
MSTLRAAALLLAFLAAGAPASAQPRSPSYDPPGRGTPPSAGPAPESPGPRFADESRRLVGPVPYTEEVPAPPLPPEIVDDKRRKRNYPDQPPVIPHAIRDYQIDRNSNKCLTCHSRQFTEQSQAPMISVTHYMDRDGNMLAAVSPRRYFCTACHVPQTATDPLVPNRFVDVDALLQDASPGSRRP